jgi:hypothetical protein
MAWSYLWWTTAVDSPANRMFPVNANDASEPLTPNQYVIMDCTLHHDDVIMICINIELVYVSQGSVSR